MPIIIYLTNMNSIEGAVLPALISTMLLLKYWRVAPISPIRFASASTFSDVAASRACKGQVKDQQIVLGFLLFAVTMGLLTQYWGHTGLHLFTGSIIIWPVLVLLLGDRFPWPLAYPLAFIGTLIPDLYGARVAADTFHVQPILSGWFFGVGGAGFHDGLFLVPMDTLIAAFVLKLFGTFMRKRGVFSSPIVLLGLHPARVPRTQTADGVQHGVSS